MSENGDGGGGGGVSIWESGGERGGLRVLYITM